MNTWSQEEEEEQELNSLVNRLLPREAGNRTPLYHQDSFKNYNVQSKNIRSEESITIIFNDCILKKSIMAIGFRSIYSPSICKAY